MDLDFWDSTVRPGKHHVYAVPATRFSDSDYRLVINGTEGDDHVRTWFSCPFCYVEVEISVLCSHLQEEHCFDMNNTVCPLCAENFGKDAIQHFTIQHAHSVKQTRKSQKSSGFWGNTSAMIGKDLQELGSFLGSNSTSRKSNLHGAAPDPILSKFLHYLPLSSHEVDQDTESPTGVASAISDVKRPPCSMPAEVEAKDCEEKRELAAFLQQLIMSTMF